MTGEFLGTNGFIPWEIENTLIWEISYSFKTPAWERVCNISFKMGLQ
jgi:hypothetical protein